jgi:hypothetical protein
LSFAPHKHPAQRRICDDDLHPRAVAEEELDERVAQSAAQIRGIPDEGLTPAEQRASLLLCGAHNAALIVSRIDAKLSAQCVQRDDRQLRLLPTQPGVLARTGEAGEQRDRAPAVIMGLTAVRCSPRSACSKLLMICSAVC